ncbi:cyclic-di-AMP-binding protein CbpB [Lacticaseibacillus brantae]|uniref:CBS domain-containing protein n=1 Tax=Lacticaseibacillus brantae DSM 23927 TaxID=1423727 RepID=A0A0R2AVZ0_9LACO|nr:cyclic-di-AMP-binding protein CbpB [Lacticaseibacillus brantae]KRM71560.1 CBS domain-containing protein [Lacticaseibacillus brantae DSM 23927]
MISKAINAMLKEQEQHFLIPGEMVASVNEDNALAHAFLVLTKVRYSKIPVLDKDSKFKGLLSMPMITDTMLGLEQLSLAPLDELCVKDVMETDVQTIENPYDAELVMHLLVDLPFIPVVASTGEFTGIVTRREFMKALNHISHNLDNEYDIQPKA